MIQRFITPAEVWPAGWKALLGTGPITFGVDPATTTNDKSNPTGIAVIEKVGFDYLLRAGIRFKTDDPDITEAIIEEGMRLPDHCRLRKICILNTNEQFWAARMQRVLTGRAIVELVDERKKITYLGEEMTFKIYLGNLVVNALDDAHLWLAAEPFVKDDFRQVRRDKGSFAADVDENGNHADLFAATGVAIHGQLSSGRPEAATVQMGGLSHRKLDAGWKQQIPNSTQVKLHG